jgi:hypothetical protein
MDQKTIKKYPGNTLVEMMTALAITSFATTLGLVIYLNIQESTRPFLNSRRPPWPVNASKRQLKTEVILTRNSKKMD